MTASRSNGSPAVEGLNLSRLVLERLARYYQIVTRMGEDGRDTFSSASLAEILGVDPTLVRHDMAQVGVTGRPKVGYAIGTTLARLDELLGLSDRSDAILVGCGNLGSAIAAYSGFGRYGLKISAVFDRDHKKVGQVIGGHVVLPMEKCRSVIENFRIQIAILTVPAQAAQETADWPVSRGVRAIWNFAPVPLRLPDGVAVQNENLALGLAQLIHNFKRVKRHEPDRDH